MGNGFFIVLDGIDGAGTETQTRKLMEYFKKTNRKFLYITIPDYRKPTGKLIHDFVYGRHNFDVNTLFLLFATDIVRQIPEIEKALKEGKVIIADRYFTSTLAYQGFQGFPLDRALQFAEIFRIPKPDVVIYLDISVETSMKRKYREKGSLDRFEKDKSLLEGVAKFYKELIEKKIFAKEWIVVNGEKNIEEVAREVQKIVDARLK